MKIIRSIKKMSVFCRENHRKGKTIGFIPTMGYLHAGHLSLVRQAKKDTDKVVISIFVNPLQFAAHEDFKFYPRDLKGDTKLAKNAGVDVIFYPRANQIYPQGYKTYVAVDELSERLCGKSRPGHFRGVTTIVSKLFHIVQPDIAYFGQKDAQQATIIKRMVTDLNMPLAIKVMPTVREKDGLAMSSRNTYLNPVERKDARVLSQALKLARQLIRDGLKDRAEIIKRMYQFITKKPTAKVDYIEIVNLNELSPVRKIMGKVLIAVAVRIGKTRLIDNIVVT